MRGGRLGGPGPLARGLAFAAVLLWALLTLFPLYWVLVTAFKTPPAVNGGPTYVPFVDFVPSLQAWRDILSGIRGDFWNTFRNSAVIALAAAAIATLLGTMAAYSLVRFRFEVRLLACLAFFAAALGWYLFAGQRLGWTRGEALVSGFPAALLLGVLLGRLRLPGPVLGNQDIAFWFISQRMFPPIVTAFALVLVYTEIGRMGFKLIDTFWGLALCYVAFALPIVVWLMRDFLAALPVEVEEAALVDDVPSWRIFVEIVLPMAAPGLAATFMITLSFIWNEFLFALFLTNARWQTLPILVAGQNSQRGDEWWAISAAALISIGPMVLVAALLGRLMRSGLQLGAIK